jgi:hypothetical protein
MRRILISIAFCGLAATLGAAQDPPAPVVRTVEVHAGLPSFEVRIVPTSRDEDAGAPHTIGRVEVSRRGEPKPFQTITVAGEGGPRGLVASRFEDANFDGYTDLLLGNDGGAKWSGYQVYLYDPASKSFVQNGLSREMSRRLTGQELEFHPATHQIELSHLPFGCQNGFVWTNTFAVQGSRLREIEETKHLRASEGCYAVRYRVGKRGRLAEVSRKRVPSLDKDPG